MWGCGEDGERRKKMKNLKQSDLKETLKVHTFGARIQCFAALGKLWKYCMNNSNFSSRQPEHGNVMKNSFSLANEYARNEHELLGKREKCACMTWNSIISLSWWISKFSWVFYVSMLQHEKIENLVWLFESLHWKVGRKLVSWLWYVRGTGM